MPIKQKKYFEMILSVRKMKHSLNRGLVMRLCKNFNLIFKTTCFVGAHSIFVEK